MRGGVAAWWEDLLDSLLDRRCSGCGGRVPRALDVCATCDARVARTGTALCLRCLHGDLPVGPTHAGACPAHGSGRIAIAGPRYEPPLDRILHAFKYEGAQHLGPWLADLVPEPPDLAGSIGREFLLVPVPLHPDRRATRGFDQALLLAGELADRWGVPVVPALERVRNHEPQARLSGDRRRVNVHGAFRVRRSAMVRSRPILLLDDVVTTGSTLLEAAAVLDASGAAWVLGIATCHGGDDRSVEPSMQGDVAGKRGVW